jgi:hypothetical protein
LRATREVKYHARPIGFAGDHPVAKGVWTDDVLWKKASVLLGHSSAAGSFDLNPCSVEIRFWTEPLD